MSTRYVYRLAHASDLGFQHVLAETHVDYECPDCGPRQRVIRHADS